MTPEQDKLIEELLALDDVNMHLIANKPRVITTLIAARDKLRELTAVVERFPKTADGVIPMYGDTIWEKTRHGAQERDVIGMTEYGYVVECMCGLETVAAVFCYSTRAALEQAIGEQP
jgi:hypothetical protein